MRIRITKRYRQYRGQYSMRRGKRFENLCRVSFSFCLMIALWGCAGAKPYQPFDAAAHQGRSLSVVYTPPDKDVYLEVSSGDRRYADFEVNPFKLDTTSSDFDEDEFLESLDTDRVLVVTSLAAQEFLQPPGSVRPVQNAVWNR